jgi:hypothetical protein
MRFEPAHHFLKIDVTKVGATILAVRMDGSTIEQCTMTPGGTSGWGCPNANAASPQPVGAAGNAPTAVPSRRACDCDFSLTGAQWIGALAASALLLAAGVRRGTR